MFRFVRSLFARWGLQVRPQAVAEAWTAEPAPGTSIAHIELESPAIENISAAEACAVRDISEIVSTPPAAPAVPCHQRADTLAALAQLRNIPALQSLAQGFLQATGSSGVPVDEIVDAIKKDSSLCVRVLGMANSAAISPERPIEDLESAVQMIGVMRIRRVAQAIFTLRDSQRMAEGIDWRHLWVHALATAALAEELERRLRPTGDSQIYLPALLHDVGKVVLSTIAPDVYRLLLVDAWNGRGRLEDLERERLGVDHREAGAIFAWRHTLAPGVQAAIAHHANPLDATEHRFEIGVIALANYLSKAHGLGFSGTRLDASDGEFCDQPAWRIVEAEVGCATDREQIESELTDFISQLRAELRGLHQSAE